MTESMTVETTYVPSTYLAEILQLLQALSEVEERLNSPVLQVKDYEDLLRQEECLKVRQFSLQWYVSVMWRLLYIGSLCSLLYISFYKYSAPL